MKVADITRLVRYKMQQRGQLDRNSNRLTFAEHDMDAVAAEVGSELSLRMNRPVLTFTRNDVLTGATLAGFKCIPIQTETGASLVTPVDSNNNDIYDSLHKLVDWAFQTAMARLPERDLQQDLQK